MTGDGNVRQAAFKGLREDKPASEVRAERPAAPDQAGMPTPSPKARGTRVKNGHDVVMGVVISKPDKPLWPEPESYTKLDLARYLEKAGYHTAHVGKWHLGGQREINDAPMITEYGFNTSLTSMEGLGERIIPIFEPVDGKPFKHPPSSSNATGRLPGGARL